MWVMSTKKVGPDISVYIGAIKIANIFLMKSNNEKGWKAHARFLDGCPEGKTVETVSDALKLIHQHLNNPPNEGGG